MSGHDLYWWVTWMRVTPDSRRRNLMERIR
jgi:hypothetical protein